MWIFNLLPITALIWFFHTMSLPEILGSLGFGVGVAITMTVLAIIFIKEKVPGGFVVNFLLLGFVLISYYLPHIDAKGDTFIHFMVSIGIPVLQAMLAMFLIVYLEVKPGSQVESQSRLTGYFLRPPLYFSILGTIAGFSLRRAGFLNFSTVFAGTQFLGWFCIWTALWVLGWPARLDFAGLRDFIVQEKRIQGRVNQATVVYLFLGFLLLCTVFEAFRGSWRLWGLTGLWAIFMFASLWRVWGFAFLPGEGPGWRYFEALGSFLERLRAQMKGAELEKEEELSIFSRRHVTVISIGLIILFIIVSSFFKMSPLLCFAILIALALAINYLLIDTLKQQGMVLEGRIPFHIGWILALATLAMLFFIYLVIFVVKQIIYG